MTKLKSKKLSGKTIAIIVMAIAMVVMMAFGATYALFTAQAYQLTSGTIYTGHIELRSGGTFVTTANAAAGILPGDYLTDGAVTVTPTFSGTNGEYLAVRVYITVGGATRTASEANLTITPATGWVETTSGSGIFIYGSDASTLTACTSSSAVNAITSIQFNANDVWVGSSASEGDATNGYMDQQIVVRIDAVGAQVKNNPTTGASPYTVSNLTALFPSLTPVVNEP